MLFVILAAIFTVMNWVFYKGGKNYHLFMGLALACTALGLCGEFHGITLWVTEENWPAIAESVPSIEKIMWFSSASFSVLNVIPSIMDSWRNRGAKKPAKGERLGQ